MLTKPDKCSMVLFLKRKLFAHIIISEGLKLFAKIVFILLIISKEAFNTLIFGSIFISYQKVLQFKIQNLFKIVQNLNICFNYLFYY